MTRLPVVVELGSKGRSGRLAVGDTAKRVQASIRPFPRMSRDLIAIANPLADTRLPRARSVC